MEDPNFTSSPGQLEIRRAIANDGGEAARIVFGILRSYGIEPDPEHLDREIAKFGSSDATIVREFSGLVSGQLKGVCTLNLQNPDRPLITALYVDPSCRGQGVGKRLLETAIREARSLGIKQLNLETREIFREAVGLYESTGWQRGPDLPLGYGPDRTYYLKL